MKTNTAGQMLQGRNQDGLVVQSKSLMLATATLESMVDRMVTTLAWLIERKGDVESILKVTL
jgi:hypothetical protein